MSRRSALPRRRFLAAAAAAAGVASPWALAQPGRAAGRPVTVAQVVDVSPAQQDVSRDFLVGARAAWQDVNARGGLRGRPVNHLVLDVDGTPGSLRSALAAVRDAPGCVALSGTAGGRAATALAALLRQDDVAIAHVAPWLQDSGAEVDDRTFPIFATRQEQIGHALRSLAVMGVQELGVVYASADEARLYRAELERIATALRLRLPGLGDGGDLQRLGQSLGPSAPALLLFVGGTPELVQFTQGLGRQARQRYLIALADVNLQTLQQMGGGRTLPVIATQPVPLVTAALPIVRSYRETLARLFDEPPVSLSLAGFIAARYTQEVLAGADAALTRQAALAAFRQRAALDLGGYQVRFDAQGRGGAFVTQSMLAPDGRVVG